MRIGRLGAVVLLLSSGGAPSRGGEREFEATVREARHAVMSLSAAKASKRPFESYFQNLIQETRESTAALQLGSGTLIDARGFVVTAFHVVDGAERITGRFEGGRDLALRVVGSDADRDIALLRFVSPPGESLRPVPLGESASLEIGRTVLALGNALGMGVAATSGVVCALGRDLSESEVSYRFGDLIQTDAAIHPGNSGGPLLDGSGELVGINNAWQRSATNVGFAIPIDAVKRRIAEWIRISLAEDPW